MQKTDFPFFKKHTDCAYFDSAATTQRPQMVLDAVNQYYTQMNTNVGRGIYQLAEKATTECWAVRAQVAQFIGAASPDEILFTAGTTAAINTVAFGWGLNNLGPNDEVLVTELEHHANFVPWQQICKKTGATLKVIPVKKDGTLAITTMADWITPHTKMVAMTHISNVTGVQNSYLLELVKAAKQVGALVCIDGAQAVKTTPVDVQKLNCDFYAFSGHKMYGPTGVGVLYMKQSVQPLVQPLCFGGGAVAHVTKETTVLLDGPAKFEAGTLPIAQIIGLGAAINYVQSIGYDAVQKHTNQLVNQLLDGLEQLPTIKIIGSKPLLHQGGSLVSFTVDGVHAHDVAAFLDQHGICVRAGHHCAQPLAQALGYDACVRISFGLYNTPDDVKRLVSVLEKLIKSELL